jgi:hypothetical protein
MDSFSSLRDDLADSFHWDDGFGSSRFVCLHAVLLLDLVLAHLGHSKSGECQCGNGYNLKNVAFIFLSFSMWCE